VPVIQITISQGRTVEQKRELSILAKVTARIIKTQGEKVRVLIYEMPKES